MILEAQALECKMFKEDIISKIKQVDEQMKEIRDMISNEHNSSPDKSFLKSSLDTYLKAVSTLDLETLEKLFEKDLKTC